MQDLDLLEWDPEVFGPLRFLAKIFGDPKPLGLKSNPGEVGGCELLAYLLLLLELLFMVMLP